MSNKKRTAKKLHIFAILSVVTVMVLGMLIGALFFIRPKKSDAERRELTKFPKFGVKEVLSGSYFKDISTWYADTYPGRDGLIAANRKFKGLYGVESKEKLVAKNPKKADKIPVEEKDTDTEVALPDHVDVPKNGAVDAAVQDAVTNGLYIKDGTVYNIYYFYQKGVERYCALLNKAAEQLDGETQVYSIVAPTNVILLDEETQDKLGGSNQTQALQYFGSKLSDKVKYVYLPDIFKKHKDEYLFYRTDHHWTADGAYYAYKMFCKQKDMKAHSRKYFKKTDEYSPFLGSFYQELQDDTLAKNPDSLKVYFPNGTNDTVIKTNDGGETDGNVITSDEAFDENNEYMSFLGGDHKLSTITNDKVDDDSACMVVCDSYGNAMVPFLVDHYHTVYVADFRFTDENVCNFCTEHNVDDLIVLGNMKIVSVDTSLDKLQVDLLGQ